MSEIRQPVQHTRLPLTLRKSYAFCLAPLARHYHLFTKFKDVTWPWTHPFWGNLSCMHWYSSVWISTRNVKLIAAPIPKNMIWDQNFQNGLGLRDSDHAY